MNRKKNRWTILDVLITAVSVVVTIAAFAAAYRSGKGRAQLLIQTPDGVYAYDMAHDRTVNVRGTLGISRIQISGGTARFLESPCRNKTCIQAAPIRRSGEWTACLPNRIFIRIESASTDTTVDALAQ